MKMDYYCNSIRHKPLMSVVWKDFTKVCDDDGVWKVKCNHSGKML